MVAHDQARLARPWALNFLLAIEQPATTSINLEFFVDIFANPHTQVGNLLLVTFRDALQCFGSDCIYQWHVDMFHLCHTPSNIPKMLRKQFESHLRSMKRKCFDERFILPKHLATCPKEISAFLCAKFLDVVHSTHCYAIQNRLR